MNPQTQPEYSLAEIASAVRSVGKDQTLRERTFGLAVRNFLDAFYPEKKSLKRHLLSVEPPMLRPILNDGGVADAYLAALANHLANESKIPPPEWAHTDHRMPDKPWFSLNHPDARMWLITQSPAAFRERNLFISEDALSRA